MIHLHILFAIFALTSKGLATDLQLAFTSTPLAVIAGQTYNLAWIGGDGTSPVAIELRRGDSANLMWVADLTTDATGGSYLWTVLNDLPDAMDYTLQLFEMSNITNVNYSARFSLSDGTTPPPTSMTTQTTGTGAGPGSSIGTGSALPRNTTFVTPTLTAAATCSGLDGICVGGASPTATDGPSNTKLSTAPLPSATTITAVSAGVQRISIERMFTLVVVAMFGVL